MSREVTAILGVEISTNFKKVATFLKLKQLN